MANIFRSKEVLKKSHKINGDTTVVPVYGVYVTGEYTPPFHNNPIVRISSIQSRKADIVDFTTESSEYTEFGYGLSKINTAISVSFQLYSKESDSHSSFGYGLSKINTEINIALNSYSREYFNQIDYFGYGLSKLTTTQFTPTILILPKTVKDMTPEPILQVRSILSIKGDII